MPRSANSSPQTLAVLEALLSSGGTWRYGYDLSRETALKSGTLYPILMRLGQQGWLETKWQPAEVRGRPPRHIYRLTKDGSAKAVAALSARRRAGPGLLPARIGGF